MEMNAIEMEMNAIEMEMNAIEMEPRRESELRRER